MKEWAAALEWAARLPYASESPIHFRPFTSFGSFNLTKGTMTMKRHPYAISDLHPVMQGPTLALTKAMFAHEILGKDGIKYTLRPFEGFRSPMRQHHLFSIGKVTKARPWQSSHQYGLAVDFAGVRIDDGGGIVPESWAWDQVPEALWTILAREAVRCGLAVPIAWDKGHVQHPVFAAVKAAYSKAEWNWVA